MATPNILAVTTQTPVSAGIAVGTGSTAILNPTSGHAYKIKYLAFANKDTVARTVTCNLHSATSGGGTAFAMCSALSIPANSTVILVGGGAVMNLGDDKSIYALAGTTSTIECVISYDDLT